MHKSSQKKKDHIKASIATKVIKLDIKLPGLLMNTSPNKFRKFLVD